MNEYVRDARRRPAEQPRTPAGGREGCVKPARGSSSEGAHVVADERQPAEVLSDAADDADAAGILVEEYLSGRFVSVEIGLVHGRFLRLAVSERSTWHRHEALEIGTTIPAGISPEEHDRVMRFAQDVVGAVGLRLGVFHVEVMLGTDGIPRLIELNLRIMGSCLPNLFRLAGGGDIFELLVRIHLNERIERGPTVFDGYATVRWFGAAERVPDLAWAAEEYGDSLHSLTVRFPEATPCRPAGATSATSARCRSCAPTARPRSASPRTSSRAWPTDSVSR
ncbi:ATP-grasp domain-containing protein [Streptomyces subrutilus]|uniref:ATP-grasp domain-containing protein n=1 Tax=Streptomyces subrutilus TaxID=36818 RepID=UPI000A628FBD|nr:ATP-grasp domain-containing protein [Streptomyces subrutilus]